MRENAKVYIMIEKDLYKILKTKLFSESLLMCPIDLLEKGLVYDQYYQRYYVWSNEKATSFIESILIGTEIPPIVIFTEDENYSEIIDGRQRFETIKRFINNEFRLKKSGLNILKKFKNKRYKDLPAYVQLIIKHNYLRVFQYKISPDLLEDRDALEFIKREIFKRYNIGLTPLKQYEIEKAIFIRNDLNKYVKDCLINDFELQEKCCKLFTKIKDCKGHNVKNIEHLMKKIRFLVSLQDIPINYYSWHQGRNDLINSVFAHISNNANAGQVFENFKDVLLILNRFEKSFEEKNFKVNRLVYETLYWIISIIKLENLDLSIFVNNIDNITDDIVKNFIIFYEEQSHYYKNVIKRYVYIAKLAENLYGADFDKYITTSDYSKEKIKQAREEKTDKETENYLKAISNNKRDPINITIKSYLKDIESCKIDIRPSYQREESMNIKKASCFIESILLNFKIAPLFVNVKPDNTKEIIDGQQRLLAILAFLEIPYTNLNGEKEYSNKNGFRLTGLKYLSKYNKLKFSQLPEEMQKRLEDYVLSVVEIKQGNLSDFDVVDLFIRLNNKPYPIKEHSFEMWNATISKNITEKIKKIVEDNDEWFYLRTKTNNKRMQNEETVVNLMYLEALRKSKNDILKGNSVDKITIFAKNTNLACMLKDKTNITDFMNSLNGGNLNGDNLELNFSKCFNLIESYIEKLKLLLESKEFSLKSGLQNLICSNKGKRTLQSIFLLWHILAPVEKDDIIKNREQIYEDLSSIMNFYRQQYEEDDKESMLISFKEQIQEFWNTYCK